jgi:transcription elongation GreA/GreB family factor
VFRIVGIDEADPERGSISWLSPLAKALLSKRAGDRVLFRGEELRIVDLTY